MSKKNKITKEVLTSTNTDAPKKVDAKRSSGGKWILLGLGVAATGTLAYFGYQHWSKSKNKNDEALPDTTDAKEEAANEYVPPKPKYQAPAPQTPKDNFPLTKGSKGANVLAFQTALIAKYGKSILPKHGADGDFGSEMTAALKKVGLTEIINETTFNLYVKGASPEYETVAKELYSAALAKDFNKSIGLLKTLRNVDDYKAVSDTFVNYRIGNVRQTLVNGMLNSFTDSKQKDVIRLAFSNMGLKYDGNKWSLSGIDSDTKTIITIQATQVWKSPKIPIPVPINMVLGRFIATRGEYTLFENESQYFLVKTQHVKTQD